jgi:putative hydrolases of HD superfamily
MDLRKNYEKQDTRESVIARDADILECLIQAKEYHDMGFAKADKFFQKAPGHLKTKSARLLWKKALKWDSGKWWMGISKFER